MQQLAYYTGLFAVSLLLTDVLPFIRDPHSLDVWSADFFCSITAGLSEAAANVG